MEHYQVGILGAGPGGYVCALRAALLGLSVIMIEGERVEGICLNRGCRPTKALGKSAELWREMGRAKEFGLNAESLSFDFSMVMQYKDRVVNTLVSEVEQLLKAAKVKVVKGWGEFKLPGHLEVNKGLTAENVARGIHAHPTLPEAIMEAAHGIMGKPLHLA